MGNDDKSISGIPISGALAIIALVLGILVIPQEAFKGSRPKTPEIIESTLHEGEDVQARLWQDPFLAVTNQRHDTASDSHGHGTASDSHGHDITDLAKQINDQDGNEIVVLGVMVDGGPYAENVESRTRYRYAVLSALGELDYVPEDSEHIGYLKDLRFAEECKKPWLLDFAPYEWFEPQEPSSAKVLVLWLNDGKFSGSPLQKLVDLAERINKAVNPNSKKSKSNSNKLNNEEKCKSESIGNNVKKFKFRILGPASSTNLSEMVKEHNLKISDVQKPPNVQIFSWAATVDMEKLIPEMEDQIGSWESWGPRKNIITQSSLSFHQWMCCLVYGPKYGAIFRNCLLPKSVADEINSKFLVDQINDKCCLKDGIGLKYFRTIGPDRMLTDLLVKELGLRIKDIEPTKGKQAKVHIALISEWDTVYGRNLPDAFKRSVKWKNICVHRFSYMRGIDGLVPGETKVQTSVSSASKKNNNDTERQDIERPAGRSQFDYLRRLAFRLIEVDDEIKGENRKKGIQAIGVLGSDVYDKLLVLQAMHNFFPTAIFFTTDMDARLFHPDELPWTQNLIVASNFGLRLSKEYQKYIPPFRDNYQTSLFLSTKMALNISLMPPLENGKGLGLPRIFEIGRTGAFALWMEDEKPQYISRFHPAPPRYARAWMDSNHLWFLFGTAVLFAIAFLSFYRQCWRGRDANKYKGYKTNLLPPCFLLLFMILLVTLLTQKISSQFSGGEPFAFFEGISIWPSEFLRFMAGGISLYFLITGFLKVRASDQELSDKFFNAHSENGEADPATKETIGKSLEAPYVWNEYKKYTNWKLKFWKFKPWKFKPWKFSLWNLRFLRILVLSAIYFFLCQLIILNFGEPFTPYRGDPSRTVHNIALFFSIPLFIVLLISTVEVTLASRGLIRRLSWDRINWPDGAARKISAEFNMKPVHLNEWISIQAIVKISETAARFIYYPFIVILILGAARLRYFDRWNMPLGLLIVIMLGLSYSVYCAVSLRSAARKAKEEILQRLWKKELSFTGHNDRLICEQIKMLYKSIESMRKGPFVPFFEQPFVRAVALFLGGGGGLVALNFL